MSQRNSEYARQDNDFYPTPIWVTAALVPHIPERVRTVWEPAAGTGHMVEALRYLAPRLCVLASDIRPACNVAEADFLSFSMVSVDGVISNPPFNMADQFISHALASPGVRFVAMLLRSDFDHAASRSHLFRAPFAKRIVLTRRITWFIEGLTGRPKASPSVNHAWFIWDREHVGSPQIAYQEAA